MTPKEKAKELYCKYADALNIRDLQMTANPFAKQCALIAVNELLTATPTELLDTDMQGYPYYYINEAVCYWQEVKTEIEKL